jgi:hypothetical protein
VVRVLAHGILLVTLWGAVGVRGLGILEGTQWGAVLVLVLGVPQGPQWGALGALGLAIRAVVLYEVQVVPLWVPVVQRESHPVFLRHVVVVEEGQFLRHPDVEVEDSAQHPSCWI